MEILPPWATALKISLDHIQKWMREGAPAFELLEWCLDHGKIKESDYLVWAKQYYSLPVLKIDFFEQPVPEELFGRKQGPYWKDSLFPVAEWDGVTFVGCLEPPPAQPMTEPVQYVLVPRSLQKIWWQALNKPSVTSADLPILGGTKNNSSDPAEEDIVIDDSFELAFELEDSEPAVTQPVVAQPPPVVAKPKVERIVPVAVATPPPVPVVPMAVATLPPVPVVPVAVATPPPVPVVPVAVATPPPAPAVVEATPAATFDGPQGLSFDSPIETQEFEKRDEFSLSEFLKAEEKKEDTVTVTPGGDAPAGLSLDLGPSAPPQQFSLENLTANQETPAATTSMPSTLSLSLATDNHAKVATPPPAPAPVVNQSAPVTPSTLSLATTQPATPVATPPPVPMAAPVAPVATPPPIPVVAKPPAPPTLKLVPTVEENTATATVTDHATSQAATPPPVPQMQKPAAAMTPPPVPTRAPTPPPMAATPPPVAVTPRPIAVTPPPLNISPAPVAFTPPPPMAMTPPPMSVTPPPMTVMPPAMGNNPPPAPVSSRMGGLSQPVHESFQKMREHFEQCMVLSYKDERLIPTQWDDTWTLANNAPPAIDLTSPSIFKIVVDTKGPYHGYVTPSAVNNAFFGAWNQMRYPEHVTIIPLVVNNEVTGMLFGTSSRVRGSMATLSNYQALASDLARRIAG